MMLWIMRRPLNKEEEINIKILINTLLLFKEN